VNAQCYRYPLRSIEASLSSTGRSPRPGRPRPGASAGLDMDMFVVLFALTVTIAMICFAAAIFIR
jgi:hypothetical protein